MIYLNPFLLNGASLLGMGGLLAYLRNIPALLWAKTLNLTTITITVKDDDKAFLWAKEWLVEQDFIKRVRRVDLDSSVKGKPISLLPAPGTHFFWHNGRPFWFTFKRSEEAKGKSWDAKRAETLFFMTPGRNPKILETFVYSIIECHKERTKRESPRLYMYSDYWKPVSAYSPRSMDAIILKDRDKENLLEDVNRFIGSRDRYRELGVPYHRGYLFYGPPGTGKTSLVSALAATLGMSVYVTNLSELVDNTLKKAMCDIPESSMVLFEDIDCTGVGHFRQSGKSDNAEQALTSKLGVTLSGLLNVLDGFHAPDNVIYVMTTNDIDSLDSALLRPGRIDYKLYMGEATAPQKIALYRRFFPEVSIEEAKHVVYGRTSKESMADFQGFLLTATNDVQVVTS